MNKTKISVGQAVTILVICHLLHTFLFSPRSYQASDSSSIVYGSILAIVLTIIFLIPIFIYYHKNPGGDLLEDCLKRNKVFGYASYFIYWLLLVGVIVFTAVRFSFFITVAIFPDASMVVTLITLFVATAYGASMGIEGIVRAGTIVSVFVLIVMFATDFTLISDYNIYNLHKPQLEQLQSILFVAWERVSNNVTLVLLVLIIPHIKGSYKKMMGFFVAISGVLSVSVFLVCILVLGDFVETQAFPYYAISSVAKTTILQRMDILQMALWVLVAYLRMAIYLLFATELLQKMIPLKLRKGSFYATVIVLLLICIGAAKLANNHQFGVVMTGTDIGLIIAIMIIPIIMLFTRRKKDEKKASVM